MTELLTGVSVPAIAAVVYWIVNLIKYTVKDVEKISRFIPLIAGVLGIICGVVCYIAFPSVIPANNALTAVVIGAASGLTATGFNQIIKQISK